MMAVWIALGIVAAGVLFWLWAIAPSLPRADFSAFHRFDYAHRGLHDKDKGVPENSLMAFDLAVRGGFGMEFDLQLTRDGQVVVHHDRSIARTCGVDKNIDEMTYEELSGYRLLGTEERVPRFTEVLELVDGRTPLIIELKSYTRQQELCEKTVELLEGYQGLYCVESFDPRIVRWFKKHRPQVVRGQLMCRMPEKGMSPLVDFIGRNLMTNFLTRPHFEAYDFHLRPAPTLKPMTSTCAATRPCGPPAGCGACRRSAGPCAPWRITGPPRPMAACAFLRNSCPWRPPPASTPLFRTF